MKIRIDFPPLESDLAKSGKALANFPAYARNAALNFYIDSFNRQGFIDTAYKRWPQRVVADTGRKTLVSRGHLRSSLRAVVLGPKNDFLVSVKTNSPYAKLHNEGGTVPVSPAMRRYFFAQMYKHGGSQAAKTAGSVAEMYRNMAITKKAHIVMPQRQFMDIPERKISALLQKRIEMHFDRLARTGLK